MQAMRSLALLPALVVLLTGCTVAQPGRDEFAAATAGRTAGPPENCVPIESQQALHVVDRQTLAVEVGRTTWINRLEAPCPGLDPSSTLVTETWGGRYCRGDHVRSVTPGMSIPGPVCVLGNFTPYRMAR
jgi:endonuclease YncB( thermonuclease family)